MVKHRHRHVLELGPDQASRGEYQNREGVTGIWDRLCVSDNERAFVEALIVLTTYERGNSRDEVLRMTDDQLRQIAMSRHPGLKWHPQTIRRFKRDYISQPPKTARRFELLRELRKGGRKKGEPVGIPSEYEPSGILLLMKPSKEQSPTAA